MILIEGITMVNLNRISNVFSKDMDVGIKNDYSRLNVTLPVNSSMPTFTSSLGVEK